MRALVPLIGRSSASSKGGGGGTLPAVDSGMAARRIEAAVTAWAGTTAHEHRFGGREFRLGKRELGHLHGDRLADLPFPKRIAAMLVETGRAKPHHVLPESGWVSFPIEGEDDVDAAIELFRLSYERAQVAAARRAAR